MLHLKPKILQLSLKLQANNKLTIHYFVGTGLPDSPFKSDVCERTAEDIGPYDMLITGEKI